MADNNNFFSDSDGQKKIDQYTQSFDSLRNSIYNLSQPINSFANSINNLDKTLSKYNDSVNKLSDQNQDLASSGDKVENKIADLSNSFVTWGSVIKMVTGTLKGWQIALTGGLAIVTAFAPEIIKFVSALFKGKDAIDQAKLSLSSLNKGLSSTDYSNAIQNLSQLRINVDLAKKGLVDKSDVVKEYNKTIGQTIGQVKSLDQVESMLKNNAPGYIQAMLYKATAMAAIKEAADNQILAQKEMVKSDKESVDYMLSGLPETDSAYKNNAERNRIAAAKPFQDKANALLKTAAQYDKLAAIIEQKNPINRVKRQIEDLKKLTDAGVVGSKTFKDIERLQKELDQLNSVVPVNNTPQTPKKEKHHPTKEELAANEKAYHDSLTKQLQDTANAFAKKVELEHNNYTAEQATLKSLLDNKLISQEQYHLESQQLEEKYHIGMGEIVKKMNQDDLAKVQQQQKDLVDAQQQKELIDKDQHKINKAILPGQKLEAEKQLITDKYNFEIQKAADAGEDTLKIRQKYQEDITALTPKYEQQRTDFALKAAQQVSDKAFSIIQGNIKNQSETKIKGLEQDKAAELSNKSLTGTQKQLIEAKYQKQENAEKVKAFKAEQKASILQAVINGALAVTKATSQTGVLAAFVIPGIIAETAIQVATIAAQKTPQYAKGGLHYQSDGRGALLPGYSRTDNTNAYLRSGEAIVVSEAMRNPWARNLVSAINVAHGGRDFSVPSTGNGYAVGGIFTDGGNANRYYNQPVNDAKDLANTLAYQMINNFPPVYVDVKDINNQQNILAQTVNRVNL